ncbi:MAG: hypothetical protein L6R45_05010 [Anaerolineae bacterium]|nr:hypothetical protein [Anaerolineae bacterium]
MHPPKTDPQSLYFTWPLLPELFPASFPGIRPGRDDLLMDIDRERLVRRIAQHLAPAINPEQSDSLKQSIPYVGQAGNAETGLSQLQQKRWLNQSIIRLCYRPFDFRWRYQGLETKPLSQKQLDYFRHVKPGNLWLAAAKKHPRGFDPPFVTSRPASLYLLEGRTYLFPLLLHIETRGTFFANLPNEYGVQPNLSKKARRYLADLGANEAVETLFYHLVAVLYAPQYRQENAEALQQNWPRLPLPDNLKLLQKSAALGQKIAALLDTEKAVPGVTAGQIRPDLKTIGLLSRAEGGSLDSNSDLAVTAGWGDVGRKGVTLAGQGQGVERPFTADERAALEKGAAALGLSLDQLGQILGETTLDIYLNEAAYWANIPLKVWEYSLGGYQVIKKWLSYREEPLLGRPLKPEEAGEVMHLARRILAMLLLEPALDANYRAVKRAALEV